MRIRGCLTLLLLAGLAACATRHAPPLAPGYSVLPCGARYEAVPNAVECGTMVVPETRGVANGRWVSFPVVRVRALNHPKADPVIFLHGGPGGDIVAGLPGRLKQRGTAITEDRDWIFFDHRGTGQSQPSLDCGSLGLSDAGLTSDQDATDAASCGERFTRAGLDLSRFNTAAVVEDLADLRKALGIDSYNLFGVSYGSRVAMGVMQRDPSGLRAVVLDSPWPPEATWTAPLPGLISRELRQVLALCARDAACNARYPNVEARLDDLFRQWLRAPEPGPKQGHSAEALAAFLLDSLYDDVGARSLPMSIAQIVDGDFTALDAFLVEQSGYTEGQFFTHLCKEEFAFESPAVLDGATGQDPIAQATARAARRYFDACRGFAVGAPDPIDNQPLTSAIPTLLLTADIDAGCPTELAVAAAANLSNSQVFEMPNMTHGVASRSPCAKRMVAAFLDQPGKQVDGACVAGDRPRFPFVLEPGPPAR